MRDPGKLLLRVGHVSSQKSDMAINQFPGEVEWDPLTPLFGNVIEIEIQILFASSLWGAYK
jgi:hypothetical protein